jgi:hypothetical protein
MTDTFYGQWRVMTTPVAFGNTWAVRVHNSDNADGMYQADSAQPWDLDVHGAEWTVELVYLDGSGQWQPAPEMNRSTGIIAPNGLTVILQSHTPIRVVSLDPTINPPMHPNPYDFTIRAG